ncbi:MAG: translation initiation factor IF-2 [bacterium]|nr:translation initiation factor IF-2 [bacterium]
MTEVTNKKIIPEVVTVGDFAHALGVPVAKVVAELMKNGVMATINEYIDFETAEIIAEYLGFEVEKEVTDKPIKEEKKTEVHKGDMVPRPPIVAVLGHVDHGKTSLLDAIRETDVVGKESGGITQHIGAYQVEKNGRKITFLDTPGHAAFEKMRQQGAEVTDIALILVAADDGVKPQTVEAINHAKKAETPMIVVITKIDKPDADITRAKQQVAELGLNPEEWGGDTPVAEVSAKTKEGLDDLLELILVMADVSDFMADPKMPASGIAIETHMDYGKGPVATILVKNGTLRVGDYVSVGETYGKIRAMEDHKKKRLKEAPPSMAVRVSGLKGVPKISDLLQVFSDEKEARSEIENIKKTRKISSLANVKKIGFEELSESMKDSEKKELTVVLKTDVRGSLDAIKEAFKKISNNEVAIKVVSGKVGDITENDIQMAKSAGNIIIGFNVSIPSNILTLSKQEKVKIYTYKVIYELLDDVKNLLSDLLPPEIKELTLGKLTVLKIFKSGKGQMVVGGEVKEGKIEKDTEVRVMRSKEEIDRAHITLVKKEKDEVREAQVGTQCGISLDKEIPIEEGDIIESFRIEKVKRTL